MAIPENPYIVLLERIIAGEITSEHLSNIEVNQSFDLQFIVRGNDWTGTEIDVRAARFVVYMQQAVDAIHHEAYDGVRRPDLIKVKIKDGSLELNAEYSEILKTCLSTMNGTEVTVFLCLCAILFAGYKIHKTWIDHLTTVSERNSQLSEKSEFSRVAVRALDLLELLEKPAKSLISNMEEGDTIKLPFSSDEIGKSEAKKLFPRSKRSKPQLAYMDGVFIVRQITLGDPTTVQLEYNDYTFRAELSLLSKDADDFFSEVNEKDQANEDAEIPLHINVRHTPGRILGAQVLGIGAPRPNSTDPSCIIGTIRG